MALPKISLHCILKVWLVLNFLFGFSVGSCSAFVALDWAIFSFTCVCSSESTVLFLFAAFLFLNDSNLVYCCFKDLFFLFFQEFFKIPSLLINFHKLNSSYWLILQLISSKISKWSDWFLPQLFFSSPLILLQNYISMHFWFIMYY